MKKALSIILAVLMLASVFTVCAAAAYEPIVDVTAYEIYFYSPEKKTMLHYGVYPKGTDLALIGAAQEPDSYEGEDNLVYYFVGWEDEETGKVRSSDQLPKATKNTTYIAVYEPREENGQTLLNFFESIFERINRIFEYFWTIFFS